MPKGLKQYLLKPISCLHNLAYLSQRKGQEKGRRSPVERAWRPTMTEEGDQTRSARTQMIQRWLKFVLFFWSKKLSHTRPEREGERREHTDPFKRHSYRDRSHNHSRTATTLLRVGTCARSLNQHCAVKKTPPLLTSQLSVISLIEGNFEESTRWVTGVSVLPDC